jgi:hypothetical protein
MPRPFKSRAQALPLFPYVPPRRDPQRTPIMVLSDCIEVAFVQIMENGANVLYREELDALGIPPVEAYVAARERLARIVRAGLVGVRSVYGPRNVRCLVFEHSILAAACVVLPNLFEMASKALKVDRMCIAIPRRKLLVVMPDHGPSFRTDVRQVMLRYDEPTDCMLFALAPASGPTHLKKDRLPNSLKTMTWRRPPADDIPIYVEYDPDEPTLSLPPRHAFSG